MKNRRRSKRGFTLVELLVVLAIITILIAILLPMVLAVRRHAQQVVCQSNLRQLGIAMWLYGQDNQYFPTAVLDLEHTNNAVASAECWPVRLRKYLRGNQKVFYCPAQDPQCQWASDMPRALLYAQQIHTNFGYELGERLLNRGGNYMINGKQAESGTFFSYGVNISGSYSGSDPRGIGTCNYDLENGSLELSATWLHRFKDVKRPSEFILMADTNADGDLDFFIVSFRSGTDAFPGYWLGAPHRGGANVLFGDGHINWFLRSDLLVKRPLGPEDAANQRMWNADNQPAQQW